MPIRRRTESEKLTYLSEEDTLSILFDSFEISQSVGGVQDCLFMLMAQLFPELRVPEQSLQHMSDLFVERTRSFFTSGKFHKQQSVETVKAESLKYLTHLRQALNGRKNLNADPERVPIEYILKTLVEYDYNYLVKDKTRRLSYFKKYFIDEKLPNNYYLAETMRFVKKYVEAKLFPLPSSKDIDVKKLSEKNNPFLFDLLSVIYEWETRCFPGQKYSDKSR